MSGLIGCRRRADDRGTSAQHGVSAASVYRWKRLVAESLHSQPCERSCVCGLRRFRPVRPAPSAWHGMPGGAILARRRSVRAALGKCPLLQMRAGGRVRIGSDGEFVCGTCVMPAIAARTAAGASPPLHLPLDSPRGDSQNRSEPTEIARSKMEFVATGRCRRFVDV